jgi:hypothetical protein
MNVRGLDEQPCKARLNMQGSQKTPFTQGEDEMQKCEMTLAKDLPGRQPWCKIP